MREITQRNIGEFFPQVKALWDASPLFNDIPLVPGSVVGTKDEPRPPFAHLWMVGSLASGVILRVIARHTDESRLRQLGERVDSLFEGKRLAWDGAELVATRFHWRDRSEMLPQDATEDGEVVYLFAAECQLRFEPALATP
jgi:hypothetical protein